MYNFRKKYAIPRRSHNMIGMKCNCIYALLLNQVNAFDQIKQLILEYFYEDIGIESAFQYWWSGFLVNYIGSDLTHYYSCYIMITFPPQVQGLCAICSCIPLQQNGHQNLKDIKVKLFLGNQREDSTIQFQEGLLSLQ